LGERQKQQSDGIWIINKTNREKDTLGFSPGEFY